MREGERLPDVTLRTPEGEPVDLRDLARRLLVVQALRYYG